NERFMYISSLGFCIILAYLVYSALGKIFKTQKTANISFAVIAAIIFILYAGKSISRNTVWVNDYTLFTHDVHTSFESAKSTCSAGGKITEEAVKLREIRSKNNTVKSILEKIDKETLLPEREKAAFRDISDVEQLKAAMALREDTMLEQAIVYLKKAVEIHNRYVDAWILLGNAHFHYNKDFEAAAACYYRIIQINPSYDKAFTNLEIIFNQCDSIDLKITTWEKVYALNPNRFEVNYQLGNLFGRYKNDVNKAIPYLENAVRINPKSSIAYKDLGVAYGFSQRYEDAIKTLLKASELDPKDAQIPVNIGVTYQLIGKPEEAMVYFQKAKTIDPNYQIPQMQ
ncbi:MAG: tetratricopeptide repeat protein, partial [Bacteroidota bacterium]